MRVEEIQMLVAAVILPPPDITVSQWADENRRLSSESAAERGEWRTGRAPYQRAIMDALSPSHPCEQVVLMSGAQLGKSSMLENFIGYIIDLDPGPILLVQPRFEQHGAAQEVHRRQHHPVRVELAGWSRHAQCSLLPAGRSGPIPGERRQ